MRQTGTMVVLRRAAGALLLALAAGNSLHADEGRIPLFQPTTITQSGTYVVTRAISSASSALLINATDVTIDLNGQLLSTTGTSASVIRVSNALTNGHVTIRNGRITGGATGIQYGFSAYNRQLRISVQEVDVSATGIGITIQGAGTVEVEHCDIRDVSSSGILIGDGTGSDTVAGRVSDNSLERIGVNGISIDDMRSGEIRRNRVTDWGTVGSGQGLWLSSATLSHSGGNLIEGNSIIALPGSVNQIGLFVGSEEGDLILNNLVRNASSVGFNVLASNSRIEGNISSGNGGDGIRINGSTDHLENNHVTTNTGVGACGLNFVNGNHHSYRNNEVRQNTTAVCNGALGDNKDGGGNIL